MGRPKKKQNDFLQAVEDLKKIQILFESIFLNSDNLGYKGISKTTALTLKQLNKKIEVNINLLPNEVQKA